MNYLSLINRFWQCDMERPLAANDTRLYMYLLHTCNALGWKNPFRHSDRHLSLRLGMAVNTVRDSRNRLQQLGLIRFQSPQPGKRGRGIDGQTLYWITGVSEQTVSMADTVPDTVSDTVRLSVSMADTVPDTVPDTVSDTVPDTVPDTVSDTNIRQDKIRQDIIPPLTPPWQGEDSPAKKIPKSGSVKPTPRIAPAPPPITWIKETSGFAGNRFVELFQRLMQLPRWKNKPRESIEQTLRQLAEYPEEFACELLSQAIAGNYKSVVYASTPDDFKRWENARKTKIDKTKINDVWTQKLQP